MMVVAAMLMLMRQMRMRMSSNYEIEEYRIHVDGEMEAMLEVTRMMLQLMLTPLVMAAMAAKTGVTMTASSEGTLWV